ncbi:MAG TPA: hypothetical protein DCY15_01620 [Ruminococcaceae bacterium]|nr:hypothetical protein [Oscillospiraceae bacterium]
MSGEQISMFDEIGDNYIHVETKNYGLPYMGSKNKIAKEIVLKLPKRKNLYDLFLGGGAVTHAAMEMHKYERYIVNDLDKDMPKIFLQAIRGDKSSRAFGWVSREDFKKYADTDPLLSLIWSFGNHRSEYMYANEVEPWKHAFHEAVYGDMSFFNAMGIYIPDPIVSAPDRRYRIISKNIRANHEEYKKAYIKYYISEILMNPKDYTELLDNLNENINKNKEELRQYLVDALKKSGLRQSDVDRRLGTQMSGHYFGRSQWEFPTREVYKQMQGFLPLPLDYEEIYGLQELMQSLQSLQRLEASQIIDFSTSYENVPIEPDSVIYCDIPYENSIGYKIGAFNHEKFFDWAVNQTEPIYISSYEISDPRFKCVWERKKNSLLGSNSTVRFERLYVPITQTV